MPLQTTVIGSYPKPAYLPTPDWFRNPDMNFNMDKFNKLRGDTSLEALYQQAERQVIEEQCALDISVITDGELRRECYYLHLCRNINGIDFENFEVIPVRNNACRIAVPVIVNRIESLGETFAWKEWRASQALSDRPIKYTLPGPAIILNSILDKHYDNPRDASEDLVKVINREILDLVKHGCKHIQLDEPQFVRNPDQALQYAIKHAERCFAGVDDTVQKTLHMCCGYTSYLDQTDYQQADPAGYELLAERLDNSIFDLISMEDAWSRNSLSLFEKYKKKTLVIGVVKVSSSVVESVEEIRARVQQILTVLPPERLILAPDCGLGYLVDEQIRLTKLKNMVQVAKEF